jgi:hypothetical protein
MQSATLTRAEDEKPLSSPPRRAAAWPRLSAVAALVLLPLVYFYPAVIGQVLLAPGDGWSQNFGVRVLIGRMIADGQLPLWNPLIFAGTPLLASIYPGALYPPNWLFAVFKPGVAMNLVVITTYHLALVGTYLFGRRTGMTRAGALVAGTAFTFGGYMIGHLGHTSRIAAAAWLPWLLLAVEGLGGAESWRAAWRWVCLGAASVALQLFAGEPQMNCYAGIVVGAYALFSLLARVEGRRRLRFAAALAAVAFCGVLLSMVQLLPERELLQHGERAAISYEYFSGYSLPPRQVVTLIFPYFFGGSVLPPYNPHHYFGESSFIEACGYVGLPTLLLALVALCGAWRDKQTWFWLAMALLALTLAFGGYLPFGLNRLLYHVPVYNLFRAVGRHLYEFTFALAVLAGLGASYLATAEWRARRGALIKAAAALGAAVAVTAALYRFSLRDLSHSKPVPAHLGHLTNAEALIPLACFALGVAAVWLYARRGASLPAALLVAVLLADLMAFGHFVEWRVSPYSLTRRVREAPAVNYIKGRERDLSSFRTVSQTTSLLTPNYDLLNLPNVSVARGLHSLNGYDAMRLPRVAAVAGEMTIDGLVQDLSAFGSDHQGLNLLNVKYLLRERRVEAGAMFDGVRLSETSLNLQLAPKSHLTMATDSVPATEIAIISTMAHATHLADGTPVAAVTVHTKEGRAIRLELQAGRDTAEWAYDRAEVRAAARHRRAPLAESWPVLSESGDFEGHRYWARLPFARAEVERVDFDYVAADANLVIGKVSLYDAETGQSFPLDGLSLPPERWRKLEGFGQVEVHENLRALPRAWFVRRVAAATSAEVLSAVKTGRLSDGSGFDPAEVALFEQEDFGGRPIKLPPVGETSAAQVKVVRYEPQRIVLETRNPQAGFLVLSEVYYRGWEAWVDGRRVPVERVNYALRGLPVAPGEHRVEMVFRAPSFRTGAVYSTLGLLALLAPPLFRLRSRLSRSIRL